MKKLKILFNTSPGAFKSFGGGEMQMVETKAELEKLGHVVKILEQENYAVDFRSFDIFHNFNIHRDNYPFILEAKNAALPIAISTIYWPSMRYALFWNKGIAKKMTAFAAETVNKIDFLGLSKVSKIIRSADALLPNSSVEKEMLAKIFHISREKIFVVHNGAEERFKDANPKPFEEKYNVRDFVLYVGRIEERKNVIALVRAMKEIDCALVIIGDAKQGSESYYEKCVKEADARKTIFLPSMPHDSKMLESAYAACNVFCLPSWYETPGLAALEAALAGANIVITFHGCTQEYFGNFALYANPASIQDIKEKIAAELQKPKSNELAKHIERNFLWENAAEETENAYAKILK